MVDFPTVVDPPKGVSYAAPQVDFSPIGEFANKYYQGAQNRRKLELQNLFPNGIPTDAQGNPDYGAIANTMAKAGVLDQMTQLLQARETMRARQSGEAASQTLATQLGAAFGGGQGAAPTESGSGGGAYNGMMPPGRWNQTGYAERTAAIESGNNPAARNPRSSASGPYQFTDATWVSAFDQTYPKVADRMTREQKLAVRDNPQYRVQQDKVFQTLTAGNEKALGSAGIPVNDVTRYAAHFFGAGDANRVLRAPEDTPIDDIVSPAVMQANPALKGRTAGEVRDWLASKINGAAPQQPRSMVAGSPLQSALAPLLQAAANPNLPGPAKELLGKILPAIIDEGKLPEKVKLYRAAQQQGYKGTLLDFMLETARAGAQNITIDQKGESAFEAEFGKRQADRWNGYITSADAAQRRMVDINNMREISDRVGTQGMWAGVKDTLGPYAQALGVKVDDLSDIQTFGSIVKRLAPQQRVPGSGATSDIEYKGMLQALPSLMQIQSARSAILDTMEAIAQHELQAGQIASRLAAREISRTQAEKELRALPDPMAAYLGWRKKNTELYTAVTRSAAARGGPSRDDIEAELRRRGLLK